MVFDLVFSYFSLQKIRKNFYFRMCLDQLGCFATIIWVISKISINIDKTKNNKKYFEIHGNILLNYKKDINK